jgi:hypothetical protein
MKRRGFVGSLLALVAAPAFGWDRRVGERRPRIPYARWDWGSQYGNPRYSRGVILAPQDMRAWPRYPVCRYRYRQHPDQLVVVPEDPRRVEFLTPDGWVFERRRSYLPPNYKSPARIWWESWVKR